MQTKKGLFMTMLLVGSVFLAMAPLASAHTCAAHEGCDASSCPDGENHSHTDYNAGIEDDTCSSTTETGDGSCYYPTEDAHLPPVVCDLLGYKSCVAQRSTRVTCVLP